MDRWVEGARSWGLTEGQKDYYASNARTLFLYLSQIYKGKIL